jgi:hypothetical protein
MAAHAKEGDISETLGAGEGGRSRATVQFNDEPNGTLGSSMGSGSSVR